MFLMFLTYMSNFMPIRYYLLFDQYNYLLSIILDNRSLKFKHLIDDIVIDVWFLKFYKQGVYKKKM